MAAKKTLLGCGASLALLPVLLFGLVFMGVGLVIRSTSQPFDDGITTVGTVVDHVERRSSDGDRLTAVEVRFETLSGQEVFFTSSTATSNPKAIGTGVEVSYRPDDPGGARNLDDGSAFLSWIFIGIGLVVLGIAALVFLGVAFAGLKMLVSGRNSAIDPPSPPGDFDPTAVDPNAFDPTAYDPSGTKWDSGETDFIPDSDRGF